MNRKIKYIKKSKAVHISGIYAIVAAILGAVLGAVLNHQYNIFGDTPKPINDKKVVVHKITLHNEDDGSTFSDIALIYQGKAFFSDSSIEFICGERINVNELID